MAITPRTILSSPAPATVAAVSLLAFTALGTLAYKIAEDNASQRSTSMVHVQDQERMCEGIREVLGEQKTNWTESDWVIYTSCFEQKNNSRMAVGVASQGLRFHPKSETLYNMKGYHQIVLGEHSEAVSTLRKGLSSVGTPRNGVMQNNLAWASLWAPRDLKLDDARDLYSKALRYDRNSCETIHTGLWVEYAIAEQSDGIERYDAYKRFLELRQNYEPCLQRAESGEWRRVVEVVGATVMFDDIDEKLEPHNSVARFNRTERDGEQELLEVTEVLRDKYRGVSINALCGEAMPVASSHHLCVEKIGSAVKTLKAKDATVKSAKKEVQKAAGGSGGCAFATQ
ncbi:MAG: tetratricopeptide repeat protein [Myxococcota bacterium]